MTNVNKKMIIPAVTAIAAALIGMVVLSPSSALAQQLTAPNAGTNTGTNAATGTTTTTAAVPHPRINITGSINLPQIIKSQIKVNFAQAANTAANQVSGGTVVGGHIGVVQGYLVYKFIVVDSSNHTVYRVLIDPGNGQVLHKSAGHPLVFHHHHHHHRGFHHRAFAYRQFNKFNSGMMTQNQTGTASSSTMQSPPMM
jgi:hypothetical protein